jgi:hypothetical protein
LHQAGVPVPVMVYLRGVCCCVWSGWTHRPGPTTHTIRQGLAVAVWPEAFLCVPVEHTAVPGLPPMSALREYETRVGVLARACGAMALNCWLGEEGRRSAVLLSE